MVLFFADVEKAFDKLEWLFIKRMVQKIDLGNKNLFMLLEAL